MSKIFEETQIGSMKMKNRIIRAAHKFLISQFLSPAFNHWTDAYGGADENRVRLAMKVCERIRQTAGGECPCFSSQL